MTAHRTLKRVIALLGPVAIRFDQRLGSCQDTRSRILTAGRLVGMGAINLLILRVLMRFNPRYALTIVVMHLNQVAGLSAFEDQDLFETNGL